jgi:hypothetical protein
MNSRFPSRQLIPFRILATSALLGHSAFAITWEGDRSGDWADGANWAGGTPPGPTETAIFTAPSDAASGVSVPAGLVLLEGDQSISSLQIATDSLILGSSIGYPVLYLTGDGTQATDAQTSLRISGGQLSFETPGQPGPTTVRSGLTLTQGLHLNVKNGFVGASAGDNSVLTLAGGILQVGTFSEPTTLEVGSATSGGIGAIEYAVGGYGQLYAYHSTFVIHGGSSFDTNNVNSFAALGTLDLRSGSTTRIGDSFQLWTGQLDMEDGADFEWDGGGSHSQIWIRANGGFDLDGGTKSQALFGTSPVIDGSKTFRLGDYWAGQDGVLRIHDGQTLTLNADSSYIERGSTWFSTLDVGSIELIGTGAIDFVRGSIGLANQGLVIGSDGMFKDAQNLFGDPNTSGDLTLGWDKQIAVINGQFGTLDGSMAGETTIRAGATLILDGGRFFTETLVREPASWGGVWFDLPYFEERDGVISFFSDPGGDSLGTLSRVDGMYSFHDSVGDQTFSTGVELQFDEGGGFTGIRIGSPDDRGKLDFRSGEFGLGTDLLFTGDSRSTVSQDSEFILSDNVQLFTFGTARIGTQFPTLDTVDVTLDGGTLRAAAVLVGPGGSFDFQRGTLELRSRFDYDPSGPANWVVGTISGPSGPEFGGDAFFFESTDTHLGEQLNEHGEFNGDFILGWDRSIIAGQVTLLDNSRLTLDGGNLRVLGDVRNGNNTTFELLSGALTFETANMEITGGGFLGDTVDVHGGISLTASNLTLRSDGDLQVSGGYLSSANFQSDPDARISFDHGYIYLSSLTFGSGPGDPNRPFGDALALDPSMSLAINGPSFMESGSNVEVGGGLFDPSGGLNLSPGATLNWTGGILGSSYNTFTMDNAGLFQVNLQPGVDQLLSSNIANSGDVEIYGADGAVLTFRGAINHSGTWKVTVPAGESTILRYTSTFRLTGGGSYDSDPAINEFEDLIIQDEATLSGMAGDQFVVGGNLNNTSTEAWNVSTAELIFTSGQHQVIGLERVDQGFGQITLEDAAFLIGNLTAYDILNIGSDVGVQGDLIAQGPVNFTISGIGTALTVSGLFQSSGPFNILFAPDFNFVGNTQVQLITAAGAPFDFTGVTVNFPPEVGTFDSLTGVLTIAIPEPSSLLLCALAAIAGLGRRRR